jgi:transcription termination/antitermination protein NusA
LYKSNIKKDQENNMIEGLDIKQLIGAITLIAEEKNLPESVVKDVIEQALAAAWRRDNGERDMDVRSELNMATGDLKVFTRRTVVEDVESDVCHISLEDALKEKKDAVLGDVLETKQEVGEFGRVAAQTAKQVILQRIREAEREVVMGEFEDKMGTLLNAVVSRVEGRLVRLELGKAQGIMPMGDQIQGERYYPGQRLKVYLRDIERGFKGPQLIVSRGCPEFVTLLFKNEVPEMDSGAVEIKNIAREAGVRTKLAVHSSVQGVDPVGTFVGGHGTRVQAVMGEVGEMEKIDIIVWAAEPNVYIANALSPTKVTRVKIEGTRATVVVPQDQLSIAIGKSGQNVRLASKLTGYEIDLAAEEVQTTANGEVKKPKLKKKDELESALLDAIADESK